MARLLFTVEYAETWDSPIVFRHWRRAGDGTLWQLAPGIVLEPDERFRPGDRLSLNRPDGSTVGARLAGFQATGFNRNRRWIQYDDAIVVVGLELDDVPLGTEVWSVDRPSRSRRGPAPHGGLQT